MKFLAPLLRSPVVVAILFVVGVGVVQPALATFYKWSTSAASNANADGTINYSEGMAPSALNDSARAAMAALAKFREDTNGSLTTGGSSTAYTIASNQVFASLSAMSGQTIRVKMSATNGASPTLNVDSLGAKNIVSVTGTAIATGALKSGAIYDFSYNNSSSEWFVINPPTVPSGSAFATYMSACPSGWTKNSTAAIDNSAALLSTSAGGSTGGSTAFTSVFTSRTIAQANLPSYTLPNTLGLSDPGHHHASSDGNQFLLATGGVNVRGDLQSTTYELGGSNTADATTGITITGGVTSGGSGTAMDFAVKYTTFIVCTKD